MEITLDFSRIIELFNLKPTALYWYLFTHGGWFILLLVIIWLIFYLRLIRQRKKYLAGIKQTLLAIDIPKDNEQSLVAVEQIFATMAGIKSGPNMYEKYWLGKTQLSFSLEIISLEGYIQFLIRTPEDFRDLVEAAIYAQYPEAEITEVEDYVALIPDDVHKIDSDYKFWGTEFTLAKSSAYPIKTYRSFEHPLSQAFIDPMASILEVMSKLGPGEQSGFQLVIAPTGDDWKEKGRQLVKKLIGEKSSSTKHLGDKLIDSSLNVMERASEAVYKLWGDIEDPREEAASQNLYQFLTQNEKRIVEAIEDKLSKLSFMSTMRIYYLAHKERFQKGRGVSAIIGAINQFNSSDMNSFKKYKKLTTDADYFFVNRRVAAIQKKLIKLYKERSREGTSEFYLGTEELATLYHFPTITVKAPLLKRTESKKAEAPSALPVETKRTSSFIGAKEPQETKPIIPEDQQNAEPDHKIKSSLPGYDFDNDYFEQRFGKKQETIKPKEETAGLEEEDNEPPANLPISQ